jgi:hypothetical protein
VKTINKINKPRENNPKTNKKKAKYTFYSNESESSWYIVDNIPATLSLGIISLPKSITNVYSIPPTLNLGIISLPKSITNVYTIPPTLSLGIII